MAHLKTITLLVTSLLLVPLAEAQPLSSSVKVRVAVCRGKQAMTLSVAGPYEIVDTQTQKSLAHGRRLSTVRVVPVSAGIKIGAVIYPADAVLISPTRATGIAVQGRGYREDVVIFKEKGGTLTAVNVLDMESYVKGVLYHEISPKWPMEAIKAQAVATRTYVVYQREVMARQPYDVTADTSSQVYGGYFSEKAKTNRAVRFTAGEVLRYKGKVFAAYFHATCGGMTENAAELWKTAIPPLAGGRVCGYCRWSPHFSWLTALGLKDIRAKLSSLVSLPGRLTDLAVAERTSTGRVRTLTLTDESGVSRTLSAKDFRRLVGPDTVRSTNFVISMTNGRALFEGKGWGHGVGLCQWGAYGMAKKGMDYVAILQFYYPGAVLDKIDVKGLSQIQNTKFTKKD